MEHELDELGVSLTSLSKPLGQILEEAGLIDHDQLKQVLAIADPKDLILICGSVFLVGEVMIPIAKD